MTQKRTPTINKNSTRARASANGGDDTDRTSLWDSVLHLVHQAKSEEEQRQEQTRLEQEQARTQETRRREEEKRREQSRARFLEDVRRKQALDEAIEQARREGRSIAQSISDELERPLKLKLREHESELKLARAAASGRLARQKHKLKQLLVAAAAFVCIGGAGAGGAMLGASENNRGQLAELREHAAIVEEEALAKVASLKRELDETAFLAEAEEGQLREALRLAQLEADAAHRKVLEATPRKTAPKKLAQAPTKPAVFAKGPSELTPKKNSSTPKKAPPTTMAYDFGMAENECNAHDPLCGNL